MKSLRVFCVLVIMMVNGINAMDDSHHINLDTRYFTGNGIGDKGQTVLHLAALFFGSDDKVTVTFCPAAVEKLAIQFGVEQFCGTEEKIKEFIKNGSKEFIVDNFIRFSRIKDASGKTPLDILNERNCTTKLCNLLKKQLRNVATLDAVDAMLPDLMEDLAR